MKKDIYHLFTEYSLSLPRGTINYNSKKDSLFNSLIDYWKEVRPTEWDDRSGWFETGVGEYGDMQAPCSLNQSAVRELQVFYNDVVDIERYGDDCRVPKYWYEILIDSNSITKYYPGEHAKPILAACSFNQAASVIAFAIKTGDDNGLIDKWAILHLRSADQLIPNCNHIKSAYSTVKQVKQYIIRRKKEEEEVHIQNYRKRNKLCLKCGAALGFFDKLTGVKECNACQRK